MRLLVLTHRFPYPPTRGDCIRVWGEVEYLSRRHEVWLACVDRQAPTREILQTRYARGELTRGEYQGMLQDLA